MAALHLPARGCAFARRVNAGRSHAPRFVGQNYPHVHSFPLRGVFMGLSRISSKYCPQERARRGPRRKYFRWDRSASNCVKAPSAQGSPRKIRKDFAWGKFSGSPQQFPQEILWGMNAVTYDQVRSLLRKGLFLVLHPNIALSVDVKAYASGSPRKIRRIFRGVNWRSALSAPIFRPLTYGKYAASPEYGGFRASHLNIVLRRGRVGPPPKVFSVGQIGE